MESELQMSPPAPPAKPLRKPLASGRVVSPFPLPVTPLEYYYLSDDRAQYPMTYPFELLFRGTLEQEALTVALDQAVARHPLLRAAIDDRFVHPKWIAAPTAEPWLDWGDATKPIVHPSGERIDLRREAGLRTWVRTDAQTTRVLFQFHHACCDGLAAMWFLEDVLIGYVNNWSGCRSQLPLRTLDASALERRGVFDAGNAAPPSPRESLRRIAHGAGFWSSLILRRPAPLAAPATVGSKAMLRPPAILDFAVAQLTAEQSAALNRVAAAHGVSRNDLLLRDVFLTIADWNAGDGVGSKRRIRLNVPVDVRARRDLRLPAANRIGLTFVSLLPRECTDRRAALAAVHRQIAEIRERRTAHSFLTGLALASGWRGLIKRYLQHDRCFATMIHSNMGRIPFRTVLPRVDGRLVIGDAVLERVAGAPPVRPLTHAGVGIVEYAGELTIGLRCDPRHFPPQQTQTLLDAYAARIAETIRLGD